MKVKENRGNPWRKWLGNILFYGLLLFVVVSTDARSWVLRQLVSAGIFTASIKNDEQANVSPGPSLQFTDAKGKLTSTADLKGKVVFVNFWATWCPPCRAEMPSLHSLYDKFKGDDRIVFLFMNEDQDRTKAEQYLQSNGYTMPMVFGSGQMPKEIYSGTLPTTVVLDKKGRIVLKNEGMANYNTDAFIRQLNDLLTTNN